MRHRLLILITGLMFFLLAGNQIQEEKTIIRSIQQSMISMECMNNVYIYDATPHIPLTKIEEFGHTCNYCYDNFESSGIVGVLFFDTNMTNFASDGNDKCSRSNG